MPCLSGRDLFEMETPGIFGGFICRTRYIDEILEKALHDGIDNIAILGAGMDTRACRIPGVDKSHFF